MAYTLKKFCLKKAMMDNPFRAPETMPNVLGGEVEGHPGFPDGSRVQTSQIKEVKGRIVKTVSGSEYRLYGRPQKEFLEWLEKMGIEYDGKEPLKGLEKYFS